MQATVVALGTAQALVGRLRATAWPVSRGWRGVVARRLWAPLLAATLLAAPSPGAAQVPPPPAPDARLVVSLLTMSPGDTPFTTYGHTAIRVRDLERARYDFLFDYGTYDATAPNAGWRFMRGDLPYWLSVSTFDAAVIWYGRVFSGITEQRLRLDHQQSRQLLAALRANAAPARREYAYHHFMDNCATRPRDLLDEAFDGALRRATLSAPSADTFRTLIDAAMRNDPLPRWVIFGLLNGRIDVPITRWRRMFLPAYLREELQRLQLTSPAGDKVAAVVQSSVLLGEERPADRPVPALWPGLLACMLLAAAGAVPLLLRTRTRFARIWAGAWLALWGLLSGAYGAVLVIAWAVSPYPETKQNGNLLSYHPGLLLLVPLGVALAMGSRKAAVWTRWLVLAFCSAIVIGWLADVAGVTTQQLWRLGLAAGCALGPTTAWLWRFAGAPPGRGAQATAGDG